MIAPALHVTLAFAATIQNPPAQASVPLTAEAACPQSVALRPIDPAALPEGLTEAELTDARERALAMVISPDQPATLRAYAFRMLVVMENAMGGAQALEALAPCLEGEGGAYAKAWLALSLGQPEMAATLLGPYVRPRHHTWPRLSAVHETLGDAYAAIGRRADAQAQWHIALATDYAPEEAQYDAEALRAKIAASAAAEPFEPLWPMQYYDDAVSILMLPLIERTQRGVSYAKLVLLENDEEDGTAYGIDVREVDCAEPQSRIVSVHSFTSAGAPVRIVEEPTDWIRDTPGDPWLPTERRLVCDLELPVETAARAHTDVELLSAYRAGEALFITAE